MNILIINGPNLNLLGEREPEVYGSAPFESYLDELADIYPAADIRFFQSNSEGEIIDALHAAGALNPNLNLRAASLTTRIEPADGIILNAGAYTHTSYAIAYAIAAIQVPVVEVHISNPAAREEFRRKSVIAPVCKGTIAGFGLTSYRLAIEAFFSAQE